jgi:hypothetical protein
MKLREKEKPIILHEVPERINEGEDHTVAITKPQPPILTIRDSRKHISRMVRITNSRQHGQLHVEAHMARTHHKLLVKARKQITHRKEKVRAFGVKDLT